MTRLDAFVARSLLQRLAPETGSPPTTSFPGAVLFVDISGYTALAETLCGGGRGGVERLGRVLDAVFRRYVRAIGARGGEIAAFAGDALIAYWAADNGDVMGAVASAQAAAEELHAAGVGEGTGLDAGTTLHIGLGAGEIWGTLLASGSHDQVLLAGPAVRDACRAAAMAEGGSTRVAAGVHIVAGPAPLARTSLGGTTASVRGRPAFDVTRHVSPRVQEFVVEGYETWIPQRCTIAALFVRIDGVDDSTPDAVHHYQRVFAGVQVALRPFTTATGTLLVDDKGLVFTLCLGMPHDTHADDAVRAVRAGLAIQAEMWRIGLDCAIGVADGDGVCMLIGGPERSHYWPVGRFMHIAGRLMEAAGTGLLCTESIAERARRVASTSPERPLVLKGMSRPLAVYRVRHADGLTESAGELFGREDELAMLDQCVTGFLEGRGTVLSIVGDAGIGKTALVGALRRQLDARHVKCLYGAAGAIHAGAYAAWRPVFESLLLPAAAEAPDARRASLGVSAHPHLAPLVNAVVPGFLEETPVVQGLAGQARADATATVLEDVLRHHVSARFALVLEDCHWMDSASWRLVLRLAQDFPQALIVLTSRPASLLEDAHTLHALTHFLELKLRPLRPDAIRQVIESVLEGHATRPEVISEITAGAVGNPLFAVEYALLMSARAARQEPAPHPRDTPAGDALPVTVQGLIASRLGALPPREALALKAASVLGDRFSIDLLQRVYPKPVGREALMEVLAALAGKQLLMGGMRTDGDVAFQHALIREVCYQQLTDAHRRELHERAAEALEVAYAEDLRPYYAMLAHHWTLAEQPHATLRYSDLAGSQALAAGAFEEAERLLTTCLQLAGELEQRVAATVRIRWLRQVADARNGMGRLEARAAAAHDALALAGIRHPESTLSLLTQAAGRLCRHAIGLGPPIPAGWDAGTILDVARALRHSGEVCYFKDDMIAMACDSLGAITYARCAPASAVLVGASAELGGLLALAGFRKRGEKILQDAIDLAAAECGDAAQAYGHMIRCLYYVGRGEWAAAEKSAQDCQQLCEPMGDRVNWTNAQAVRFWMYHHTSQEAAALDAATRVHGRALETGNRQHRAWGLRFLAVCVLDRNPAEAARYLHEALQHLNETSARNERFPTLGLLALAQLRAGDEWAAAATARPPIAELKKDFANALAPLRWLKRPINHATLEGYSALFSVALDCSRRHRVLDRSDMLTCLRVLRRLSRTFEIARPRQCIHEGDLQRVDGAVDAARTWYERGRTIARERGMPRDLARCNEALARLGR